MLPSVRAWLGLVGGLVVLGILATFAIVGGERRADALEAERDAARDSALVARQDRERSLRALDSLGAAFAPLAANAARQAATWERTRARAEVGRLLDSIAALGIPGTETVTVRVPVEVLVAADSAINSCSAALSTCEAIRAEYGDYRGAAERELGALRRQVTATEKLISRPWTAVGPAVDDRGRLGVAIERDVVGRLRFGVSVGPGRGELRALWRW